MAITNVIDFTEKLNASGSVVFDTSGWDSIVIQGIEANSCNLLTSNDGGDVTGSIDSNVITAANFYTLYALDLSDSTGTLANAIGNSNYYLTGFGRYIKIGIGSGVATKLLVKFHKIG